MFARISTLPHVLQKRNFHSNNSQDPSSHPFRFPHFNHDVTTAADPSQINNVKHGVGMLVVTILIIVAAIIIVALLCIFLIINTRRKRRISDRMAREESGTTVSDYPTSPAVLFRPQYSQTGLKSLLSRTLERLRLKKKAPPSKTQIVVNKEVLERWDPHARHPSDGIRCTKNDPDEYSTSSDAEETRSPTSLPSGGLSSAQNPAISTHSSEVPLPHHLSSRTRSEKYSRAAANQLKRPNKALLVMGASLAEAYPDNDTRGRLGVDSQYIIRRGNEDPSRVSVSTSVSGTRVSFASVPTQPDRVLGRNPSQKRATGHSSFTSSGTIPEFRVPDDTDGDLSSLRVASTTEKSFSASPRSGKRFDSRPTSGTSAQYASMVGTPPIPTPSPRSGQRHATRTVGGNNALQLPALPSWGLMQTFVAPSQSPTVAR